MKQNQTQFERQRAFIGLLICFIVVFVLNKTSHNKLFRPGLSLVSLAVFSPFADDFLSAPYYCQFTYNLQIAINLIARIKTFPSHCNATFFCLIDVKHTHTHTEDRGLFRCNSMTNSSVHNKYHTAAGNFIQNGCANCSKNLPFCWPRRWLWFQWKI